MKQKSAIRGLFAFEYEGRTRFVFSVGQKNTDLQIAESTDGLDFHILGRAPIVSQNEKGTSEWEHMEWARVSECANKHIVTYAVKRSFFSGSVTRVAVSRDGMLWELVDTIQFPRPTILIETVLRGVKTYTAYALTAHGYITASVSKDLKRWREYGMAIDARSGMFDAQDIEPLGGGIFESYLVVLYTAKNSLGRATVGAALFDTRTPNTPLWRSDMPLWTAPPEWDSESVRIVGSAIERKYLYLYFERNGSVEAMPVPKYWERPFQKHLPKTQTKKKSKKNKRRDKEFEMGETVMLERFGENPILEPIEEHPWESFAAFNPAAFMDGGIVHLLYRAQSHGGLSVLGYAKSLDGYRVHFRAKRPAYTPREPFEGGLGLPDPKNVRQEYMSAGGYGGCEDPKATCIDNRVYVTYVAFNGWQPPRIALAWIPLPEFLKGRWKKWSKPVLISPPGVVDKSAAILPEKVNGKYVIFHRIFPNILIDFVDSLEAFDGTQYLKGRYYIAPREGFWDCGKLSIGAPPIKTEKGWLVIYHAVSGRIEHGGDLRYKIGAMLLDLEDPTKVLVRSREPILEPETEYENNGHKYGIAYPCGAIEKDGTLFVYYGASDKTTAVATASIKPFLKALLKEKPFPLKKISLKGKKK